MVNILEEFIKTQFVPTIVTTASVSATEFCKFNGITPADLLRPFSSIKIKNQIKSSTKQYNIKEFTFRVTNMADLDEPNYSLFSQNLKQILSKHTPPIDPAYYQNLTSENKISDEIFNTPYLIPTLNEILRFFSSNQYNLINLPLSIVAMATTSDDNPVSSLNSLLKTKSMSPLYKQEVYDSQVPIFYILLHDINDTDVNLEKLTKEMKSQFSSNKFIIVKFDKNLTNLKKYPFWDNVKQLSTRKEVKLNESINCGYLLDEGLIELQALTKNICSKGVFIQIQDYLSELESAVNNQRRGFTNTLKGWLKKTKSSSSGTMDKNSITWKTLELGYIYMILKEYEQACECFSWVKEDFKSENNSHGCTWMYFLIALCKAVIGEPNKIILHNLQSGYDWLTKWKENSKSTFYMKVLLSLFLSILNETHELNQEMCITWLINTLSIEDDLITAVLFVQLCKCLLDGRSFMYKKSLLYYISAMNYFYEHELYEHVVKCCHVSLMIINDLKWYGIKEHITRTLCDCYKKLDYKIHSIPYYLELISSTISTNKELYTQIVDFKSTINELITVNKSEISIFLDLPNFYLESVAIVPSYSSKSNNININTSIIKSLLSNYNEEKNAIKNHHTRLNLLNQDTVADYPSVYSVNEIVQISIKVYNPLSLKLQIKDMLILAEIFDENKQKIENSIEFISYTTILEPKSQQNLILSLKPLIPGKLIIKGCTWIILDYLPSQILFNNNEENQKNVKFNKLECNILDQQGSLNISWNDFPTNVFVDQVIPLNLQLKNDGYGEIYLSTFYSQDVIIGMECNKNIIGPEGPSGKLFPLKGINSLKPNEEITLSTFILIQEVINKCCFFISYNIHLPNNDVLEKAYIDVHNIETEVCLQTKWLPLNAFSYNEFNIHSELYHNPSKSPFNTKIQISKISTYGKYSVEETFNENDRIEIARNAFYSKSTRVISDGKGTETIIGDESIAIPKEMENLLKSLQIGSIILKNEFKEYQIKVKEAHIKGLSYQPKIDYKSLPIVYKMENNSPFLPLFYHWRCNSKYGITCLLSYLESHQPLFYALKYSANNIHDFNNGPLSLTIEVQLLNFKNEILHFTFSATNTIHFYWIGKTTYDVTINPLEKTVLNFTCLFAHTGIYNVNTFEYYNNENPSIKYYNKDYQYLLTIKSVRNTASCLSRTRRSSTSIVEGLEIDQLLLIDDEMEERDSNLRKSRRSDEGLVDLDMKTPVTD